MNINKRWSLVNKKSGLVRMQCDTRDVARMRKRDTERLFDNIKQEFVR